MSFDLKNEETSLNNRMSDLVENCSGHTFALPASDSLNPVWNPIDSKEEIIPYYDRLELPVKLAEEKYQVVGGLGTGSFGSVILAKIKNGYMQSIRKNMCRQVGTLMEPIVNYQRAPTQLVAIKIMIKKLHSVADYSRVKEVNFILSVSSHPNLVQIYDVFIDKMFLKLHIVMETMNQNLYQLMKTRKGSLFSPPTLKNILAQLLAAIRHIHRSKFFHRDIKPENILVMPTVTFYGSKENVPPSMKNCTYVIKLADYGLARHVSNNNTFTAYVSTRWYRSPEILLRKKKYSFPVDIWAFGCVAVETATFNPLLPGQNELDQTWKVLELLGCPERINCPEIKEPLGGYWDEAQPLAAKLGFCLPKLPGTSISHILPRKDIPRTERYQLYEIVKSCLTWDAGLRAKAEILAKSLYFQDTVLTEEDKLRYQKGCAFINSLSNLGEKELSTMKTKKMDNINLKENTNPVSSKINQIDGSASSTNRSLNKEKKLRNFDLDLFHLFRNRHTNQRKEEKIPSLEKEDGEDNNESGSGNTDEENYQYSSISMDSNDANGIQFPTESLELYSSELPLELKKEDVYPDPSFVNGETQLTSLEIPNYDKLKDFLKDSEICVKPNLSSIEDSSFDDLSLSFKNSYNLDVPLQDKLAK